MQYSEHCFYRHGGARMRIQAMREGAVEFLAKPVDHHLLLETVRAALNL